MNNITPSAKHKIVIVGGGAAGLELATRLGNKLGKKGLAEITLLDAMHQVAIHGYFQTAMLTLSNIFRRSAHARIKLH